MQVPVEIGIDSMRATRSRGAVCMSPVVMSRGQPEELLQWGPSVRLKNMSKATRWPEGTQGSDRLLVAEDMDSPTTATCGKES